MFTVTESQSRLREIHWGLLLKNMSTCLVTNASLSSNSRTVQSSIQHVFHLSFTVQQSTMQTISLPSPSPSTSASIFNYSPLNTGVEEQEADNPLSPLPSDRFAPGVWRIPRRTHQRRRRRPPIWRHPVHTPSDPPPCSSRQCPAPGPQRHRAPAREEADRDLLEQRATLPEGQHRVPRKHR